MTIQEAIHVARAEREVAYIRRPSWGTETKLLVDVVYLFEVEAGKVSQDRAHLMITELLSYDWEVAI